jgi:pSer/pThr/pTyr-binding forkhead associated (FHA) protein
MVLESDIECLSKAIHVIVLDKKSEFNIGRRINNDVTVSDISVSRKQSTISIKDDKIFIEDCDSKFGTFVKIRGAYRVKRSETLPL